MAAETLVDRLLALLKDNPVVAALVLLSTVVVGLSRFTDALKSLRGLLFKAAPPKDADVGGVWATGVLSNRFDPNDTYRLTFSLQVQGKVLIGSVRQTSASPRSSYDVERGLLDGRVEGDAVTFHTQHTSITSRARAGVGEPPEWVENPYKVLYRGSVVGDELRFLVQDDRGNPPEDVTARRAEAG